MIRHVFLFLGTFALGALIALLARAALHDPHAAGASQAAAGGAYAPMVSNRLAPAGQPAASTGASAEAAGPDAKKAETADPHAGHGDGAAAKPVNTVCAICGMAVDPTLPTLQYQGKTIGFGCRMCPPKFKADPDRYGPYYLRNELVKP